jgi:Mn2+/Fe2+ NRAMP family transporter
LHFLPALINSFLIIVFRVLLLLNDQRTYNEDYTYVPKLGIILLLVWLLYFPIRLFLSPKFISEES